MIPKSTPSHMRQLTHSPCSAITEFITSNPKVYDFLQNLFGMSEIQDRLVSMLAGAENKVVLDAGAGTGPYRVIIPATARYVWIDNDQDKLRGFQTRKKSGDMMLLGDVTSIALTDKCVDYALCVAVSHHLPDAVLSALFRELSRVVREKLIFLDALLCPKSLMSRLLWRYDLGEFPRSAEVLLRTMDTYFQVEHIEQFTCLHRFILAAARPRIS